MRILIVHNYYQQFGGEDAVVEQEVALLRGAGHVVIQYCRSNHEVDALGFWEKITLPKRVVWASDAIADLGRLIRQEKPDVAHFHNTLLMISPAAYSACREADVPTVQTLHNYRLLCPNALFFRSGHVCEDCLGQALPWPGVVYSCYRNSRMQTAGIAAMLTVHRWLETWQDQVDIYIALTEFARQKFIQGGLPAQKIVIKPHFVYPDPGPKEEPGEYILFTGRLSPEKGIQTLLRAWQSLKKIPLKIVGDGPLRDEVQAFAQLQEPGHVEILGQRTTKEVLALMKKARCLLFPSECYETFGRVAAEAFACGVPVIASRLGAMAEIVEDGRTGLHFTPGDSDDLAAKVEWVWAHPQATAEIGQEARREYEAKYTAEKNYSTLIDIYRQVTKK